VLGADGKAITQAEGITRLGTKLDLGEVEGHCDR
jgi:hypothetical protein